MRSRRVIGYLWPRLVLALTLCLSVATPPGAAQAPTFSLDPAALAHAATPPFREPKMESAIAHLAALADQPVRAQTLAQEGGLRLEDARLQVQVAVAEGAQEAIATRIAELGGVVTGVAEEPARLQAWLPLGALYALAALDDALMLRRPPVAIAAEETLSPDTLAEAASGVQASAAHTWHASGYLGQGVRLAIIDLGFEGYTALLGSALPVNVIVRNFVDGEGDGQVDGGSAHGTACAEIAHAVAPQATLYLVKISTDIDLAKAITWLRDVAHIQVISMSLGWYTLSPGDGTGALANLAASARAAGIVWVASAGNQRQAHWGGPWWDADNDGYLNFGVTQEVNYLSVEGNYLIPPGVILSVYLRWSDWSNVDQDYDLILLRDSTGNGAWVAVASSTNMQTGGFGQTPTEWLANYRTSGQPAYYGFAIQRDHSSRPVQFEAFAPQCDHISVFTAMRSISLPADAPDVLAVGAVRAVTPYGLEPYSSEGPTNGPGGAADGGRLKPDLAGYDAVETATWGLFTGTSAAAPHVAGAAAVIRGAYPSYNVAEVRAFLSARARDMGSAGADTQYGAGRLYLGCSPICPVRIWLALPRRP